MLEQVPFFLTWRYYWDLPELAQAVFEYFVALGWERWLTRLKLADAETHCRIVQRMDDLSEEGRRRFLTAPETYRLLCTPNCRTAADSIAFVLCSLSAESARSRPGEPLEGTHWTALGDARVTDGPAGDSGRFQAPILARGIVVDTLSPHAYLEANPTGRGEPLAEDELAQSVASLTEAADRLRGVSGAAYDTLCTSLSVITVRRNPAHPDASSSSWPWLIGKMGLANPSAISAGQRSATLSNALVHEAIHSLIYRIELVDPLYVSHQQGQDVVTYSPWSRRELRLHSFVHACFVWFGLWSFWSLAETSGVFPPATAREFIECSARGFRDPSLPDQLAGLEQHLTAPGFAAIRRVRDTVVQKG